MVQTPAVECRLQRDVRRVHTCGVAVRRLCKLSKLMDQWSGQVASRPPVAAADALDFWR